MTLSHLKEGQRLVCLALSLPKSTIRKEEYEYKEKLTKRRRIKPQKNGIGLEGKREKNRLGSEPGTLPPTFPPPVTSSHHLSIFLKCPPLGSPHPYFCL